MHWSTPRAIARVRAAGRARRPRRGARRSVFADRLADACRRSGLASTVRGARPTRRWTIAACRPPPIRRAAASTSPSAAARLATASYVYAVDFPVRIALDVDQRATGEGTRAVGVAGGQRDHHEEDRGLHRRARRCRSRRRGRRPPTRASTPWRGHRRCSSGRRECRDRIRASSDRRRRGAEARPRSRTRSNSTMSHRSTARKAGRARPPGERVVSDGVT